MARPRRSREQWRKHVSAWKESGQSRDDYASAHGLNPNTLAWWRSQLGRDKSSRPLTLVPVIAGGVHRDAAPVEPVEVVIPRGITVRVPNGADIDQVARLVRALAGS